MHKKHLKVKKFMLLYFDLVGGVIPLLFFIIVITLSWSQRTFINHHYGFMFFIFSPTVSPHFSLFALSVILLLICKYDK